MATLAIHESSTLSVRRLTLLAVYVLISCVPASPFTLSTSTTRSLYTRRHTASLKTLNTAATSPDNTVTESEGGEAATTDANTNIAYDSPTVDLLGPPSQPTVWSYFANLTTTDTANLGQGFPDTPPPNFLLESLKASIDSGYAIHQYTNPSGHPPLVAELIKRYENHLHQPLTPSNVAITVGASQALYLSLRTIVTPGSEVIIFEPFFDLYVNQVKVCGGVPKFVPLRFDGTRWKVDEVALKEAISEKTR